MSEAPKTTLSDGSPVTSDHRELKANGQQRGYVVLSDEERAKGFVRPVRLSYVHVGRPGPRYPLRDPTVEERESWGDEVAKYEEYPESEHPVLGRFWTQQELDSIGVGCGTVTTMSRAIAETYAREPGFYGATFCCGCHAHLPVGEDGLFVWEGTDERVGT